MSANKPKLLCIGVDAGSPQLFKQWATAGKLPTLQRLLMRAAEYPVVNPYALEAGAVWPVFHAALNPGKQPQYDGRRYFDPESYGERWYEPDETTRPFWMRLSDQGLRCLVIDPPYIPLHPEINGRMVVDWGTHVPANGQRFDFQTHPPALKDDILAHEGPDPAGWISCDRSSPESVEDYAAFMQRYLTRIDKRADMACRLLRDGDWQFALLGSTDLHCTGHHLWHVTDRTHPQYRPELEARLGPALETCYQRFDAALARILDVIDDNTTVLLFGSHGMGPQYTGTGLLDRILSCIELGQPARTARGWKSRLRGLWHTIPADQRAKLQVLRKPFAGKLHTPRFLGNRESRRFFEVYANNASGGVRINLIGRESNGLVSEQEFAPLVAKLRAALLEVVNVDTGQGLADDVIITRDKYSGPHLDALPDLLVRWNRDAPIRMVESPLIGRIAQESVDNRTGDHSPEGVLFALGPHVNVDGLQGGIAPEDFAPTVSALFGMDPPPHNGKPIPGIR